MYDHGGMNRFYRLVWSEAKQAYVPIPEVSNKRGKRKGGVFATLAAAALALLSAAQGALADPGPATSVSIVPVMRGIEPSSVALPTGGIVVGGQASIAVDGKTETITQTSQNAAIDWQSFNIGQEGKVIFNQPSTSAIALNRVLGGDASKIYGTLQANGQVFLVNPNGVLFAKGAQVSAAGIMASTRDMNVADFMAGKYVLSGTSTATITNAGSLTAANGGYIVLVGANVVNDGSLTANLGDVRLAAAQDVTIRLDNGGLTELAIDKGAYDALVANNGVIKADGGRIYLTADALDAFAKASVSNAGVIEALTVGEKNGKIILLGDMQTGTTTVGGTLNASAPSGGNGGSIETSGAHVHIDTGAVVTTKAANGLTGSYLIDPVDFTIAASGGDMTGADLATALGSTNVTILSTSGASGTAGDINVNDTVSWSANTLTLNAQANITITRDMTASGTGALALEYGQSTIDGAGFDYTLLNLAVTGPKINLPSGQNFSTKKGSAGQTLTYTVINSLGGAMDQNATTLQGMNGDLAGLYVLGSDIDASATSTWNHASSEYLGFNPIGTGAIDPQTQVQRIFTGKFDGLGHTVSSLYTNRVLYTGMFGLVSGATIRNITLANTDINGSVNVGALVGSALADAQNTPTEFRNISSSGTVRGESNVGGLVGYIDSGSIDFANSTAEVKNGDEQSGTVIGGILGKGVNSYLKGLTADGNVSGDSTLGGAIGATENSTVLNTNAHGTVTGAGGTVGGLIGSFQGTMNTSNAIGNVSAGGSTVGGLVGYGNGSMTDVSTSGTVEGNSEVGGLAGVTYGSILRAYTTGAVTGTGDSVGGMVGNSNATITDSNASGNVLSTGSYVGGLAGQSSDVVTNSQAHGTVQGYDNVGGLIGMGSDVANGFATGDVTGHDNVGGLVGQNKVGTISDSSSFGMVSGNHDVGGLVGLNKVGTISNSWTAVPVSGVSNVGGLVGEAQFSTISDSHSYAQVTGTDAYVGGLVGFNDGSISNSYTTGNVSGTDYVGGLMGFNTYGSSISAGSTASGAVGGNANVGGFVGRNEGNIDTATASGDVTATAGNVGGFAGSSSGTINGADAHGTVNTSGTGTGGLVGDNSGYIGTSNATGDVATGNYAGGAVGYNSGTIDTVTATGNLTGGGTFKGGLVGHNDTSGSIANSTATGNVNNGGNNYNIGGLVGSNDGTVSTSHANGAVAGWNAVGGLVGRSSGTISDSSSGEVNSVAGGSVTGFVTRYQSSEDIGGLVGAMYGTATVTNSSSSENTKGVSSIGGLAGGMYDSTSIIDSHASGDVSANLNRRGDDAWALGGLVGSSASLVQNSYATGAVDGTSRSDSVGGLIGDGWGDITGSYATGAVNGGSNVGGLIGFLNFQDSLTPTHVTSSYASGNVSGDSTVGGVLGFSGENSILSDITATGTVTGNQNVGGLIGQLDGTLTGTFTGQVSNVTYGNSVMGGDNTGGLVGLLHGTLSGVSSGGTVSGGANVGGLVGRAEEWVNDAGDTQFASIEDAATSATVNGDTVVGGFIGSAQFTNIATSSASGGVTATGNVTGGFAGNLTAVSNGNVDVDFHGKITDSSTTSTVQGAETVGGFIGETLQYGIILNGSASGDVSGSGTVGGFAGAIGANSGIAYSEAHGNVTGYGNTVGGFVGDNAGIAVFSQATGTVGGVNAVGGFAGHTASTGVLALDTASGAVTSFGQGQYAAGGFIGINEGMIEQATSSSAVSGDTEVGGLVGRNTGQIHESSATGTVGGNSQVGGFAGSNAGSIDTAYATGAVTGTQTAGGFVGANTSQITNAHASGTVTGEQTIGGFGGDNTGSVEKVYATGDVTATGSETALSAGGLFGHNDGTISVAYAQGNVIGTSMGDDVGGLVGLNSGGISDAYATGNVSGHSNVGGITGRSTLGSGSNELDRVYAGGHVSGTGSAIGGVIGYIDSAVVNDAYWNSDATGQANLYGYQYDFSSISGGGALTNAQSKTQSSYAGFDFSSGGVWKVYENSAAPLLTAWLTNVTVTVSDAGISYVYNGQGKTDGVSNLTWSTPSAATSGHIFGNLHYDTSKNAGTYTDLYGMYSDQQGYNITFVNTGSLTITPKSITVIATGQNKTYDGNTAIGVTLASSGIISGDDLSFTGSGNTLDKNAGLGRSVSVTGIAGSGADLANYSFSTTASTTADISKKTVTVTGTGTNRIYDGTTSVAVNLTSGDILNGDTVAFGGTGAMADKTAGAGKGVAISGISASGDDAQNYVYNTTAATTVDIAKKVVTVTGNGVNRTYDGTASVGVTLASDGIVTGDSLSFTGTGVMADKNAGMGKGVAISNIAESGQDAQNYTVANTTAAGTVDIAKKTVTVTGTGTNRTYDGTTAVAVNLTAGGILDGDTLAFTGAGTMADKNAGQGKAVAISGITGSGDDAQNYAYNTTAATTADIAKKSVTVTGTGTNRTYDGTTSVGVTLSSNGLVSGDTVAFSGTGAMADKNAGQGKAVAVSGITGSGDDAQNYAYNATSQTTADIAKKVITVTGTGINRTYDGTTSVGVTLASDGLVSGDTVAFTGIGTMADKNADEGRAVSVTGIAGSGEDAQNYAYNTTAATTVDIAKKVITVTGTGSNRTYDGTTSVGVTLASDGLVSGDTVAFTGTGTMADKTAGQGKAVAVSGISGSGEDAQNYAYNTTAAATADIGKKTVTLTSTAMDKTYDGSATVGVTVASSGVVTGDTVAFAGSGTLADKNAGQAKAVNVAYTASGADVQNYAFAASGSTTANVGKASLNVSLVAPIKKLADGTTTVALTMSNFSLGGLVAGENIAMTGVTGSFADATPGTGKTVTATLGGPNYVAGANTNLANYQLVTGAVSANFGEIVAVTNPAYDSAVSSAATTSTNTTPAPGTSFGTGTYAAVIGQGGAATSTGGSDNGVSTQTSGGSVDGGIASMQSRDTLVYRRTFSIADGGIRLPSGVSDGDAGGANANGNSDGQDKTQP